VTKDELKKSIEKMVDDALDKEESETIEKGNKAANAKGVAGNKEADHPKHNSDTNGGDDSMKSGSPYNEKESPAEPDSKGKKMKKAGEDEESDEDGVEKAYPQPQKQGPKSNKDPDSVTQNKEKKSEPNSVKQNKQKSSEPSSVKKSQEGDLGDLTKDEVDLVKAWRADNASEAQVEQQLASSAKTEEFSKSLAAATGAVEDLRKVVEDQQGIIKSLTDKVEKIASQPAYDKRSLSTLEPLEKSGDTESVIPKARVLDKMLELQRADKGVTSKHVSEFEVTRNISDPSIRNLVMGSFKNN
jgi:hypothetical protein